jgi:hypothetical protein
MWGFRGWFSNPDARGRVKLWRLSIGHNALSWKEFPANALKQLIAQEGAQRFALVRKSVSGGRSAIFALVHRFRCSTRRASELRASAA